DVDHKTTIYYARYVCRGASKVSFTTIDDRYLSTSKEVLLAFPYLLTYKSAISLELFDLVYDSMLTTKGISGATNNIVRHRETQASRPPLQSAFASPVEQYMTDHGCLDSEVIQKLWLTQTAVCSTLVEAHMASAECVKVLRVDHSQKFCSQLKVFGADGSKEQVASVRMLLLVQNEVGQLLARGLTKSENHEETTAILQPIANKLASTSHIERFLVKQDPFHVIQRLTEKISDSVKRQWLSKRLSEGLYDVEGKLRSPDVMERMFTAALATMNPSDIRVSSSEWEGCVKSNLEQIHTGDLFVETSNYCEGGCSVRVVSTSQLEAIHSKLRKLLDRVVSIEDGLRILDIFLLQVQPQTLLLSIKKNSQTLFLFYFVVAA
ncbi:hypothetical protein PHYSODRAFT_497461, partial [Phytophthora sojae]